MFVSLYSLYPQDPEFKSISIGLKFKTDISASDNGHDQGVSRGGAGVEIDAKYNSIEYLETMRVRGFLAGQEGKAGVCDLILPVESHTFGDIAGSTPRCAALTAGGSKAISLKDALPNKTLRHAGEWIQFAGHDKAYMLTQNLVTDGSGTATINLVPSTYEQILLNEQIIIDEVVFKVRAESDIIKTTIKKGMRYTFSVKFVEAIR